MLGIAALLLVGVGIFGAAIWPNSDNEESTEFDDSNDESGDSEDVGSSILESVIELEGFSEDPEEFRTGEGDDSIIGTTNVDTLNSEAGDDTISILSDHSLIDGGAGDDQVTVEGYANTITGGDGDDIIEADGPRNTVLGGAGNDHLTYDGGAVNFEAQSMDGEEGDDTLVSAFGIGPLNGNYPEAPQNFMTLTGGEGADRFELEIEAFDPAADFENGDYGVGLVISDFEPGVDQLAVSFEDSENYNRLELREYANGERSGTLAIFHFLDADSQTEGGIAVDLRGATGVSADDIDVATPG